jgi:hypothetical protein
VCYAKLRQVATVAVKAGVGWCFDHPSYRQGVPSVSWLFARFTEIVWASYGHRALVDTNRAHDWRRCATRRGGGPDRSYEMRWFDAMSPARSVTNDVSLHLACHI